MAVEAGGEEGGVLGNAKGVVLGGRFPMARRAVGRGGAEGGRRGGLLEAGLGRGGLRMVGLVTQGGAEVDVRFFALAGVGGGDRPGVGHVGGAVMGGLQAGAGGVERRIQFKGHGEVLDGAVVAFGVQGAVAFEVGGVAAGEAQLGGEGGVVRELGLAQQRFFKVMPSGDRVADGQGVAARAYELLGGAGRQEHGEKKKDDEGARGVGHGWVSTCMTKGTGFGGGGLFLG